MRRRVAEAEVERIRADADADHTDLSPRPELDEAKVEIEADLAPLRGRRFITKFEERSHMHRLHPMRLWRVLLGVGLMVFGLFNAFFVPGPGGSAFVLASLLVLAGESKLLARLLDWAEVKFQRQVDWALRHKILAALIISGAAFTFTVCVHRLLRGTWLPF